MKIRKFESADLDEVMNIWLQGNLDAHPFIPATYWQNNFQAVKQAISQAQVWVMTEDHQVIAFIGLQTNYIAGVFVARKFRGQGLGGQLLEFVQSKHKRLQLSVYQDNQAAFNFYCKHNFKIKQHRMDLETNQVDLLMEWSQ